jgi:hypothetical protein
MRHTDYRTLIDRGRKAGLGTSELYRAIAARQPEGNDQAIGQADGNGFASGYDPQGRRLYQPVASYRRP